MQQLNRERVCRASVAPQVLGSTPFESEYLRFNDIMILVVGDVHRV